MSELRLVLDDVDCFDLSDDIETLLRFTGSVVDLSPSFQRLLMELDEAVLREMAEGTSPVVGARVEWAPTRLWTGARG